MAADEPATPPSTQITGEPIDRAASDPAEAAGIQTSPGQEEPAAIVLPPRPAPPPPEGFLRRVRFLDGALVLFVLTFAFLVALFPIRNSDLLLHLAMGRAIANGDYHFGTDPFTYTSEGVYWVNHSWLFDLTSYALYEMTARGGELLVIFKALAIAALAFVLLQAGRRPGQSLWIPAVCTALAVLVVSPRLLLQPTIVSYLFLGVTFWLLQRWEAAPTDPAARRSLWLLPLLFILWVNLDDWFLLGPLTVGLYLAALVFSERFRSAQGEPAGAWRTLGLIFVAGLAACLVNPHHYHAFELPDQLGLTGAAQVLRQEGAAYARAQNNWFGSWFVSPFTSIYFQSSFLSAAGLAYFLLALLGIVSFVLTWEFGGKPASGESTLPRLVIWMAFFALSFFYVRVIPFFAIVAGPIAARNFLEFAARRFGAAPRLGVGWRRWSLAGRTLSLLACVVLMAAAWPGWLQARPHETRRVGVGMILDPSLVQAAEKIKEWREKGLLPEGSLGFNVSPPVADYLAWFCPQERTFFNFHLSAAPAVAHEYSSIRRALIEGVSGAASPASEEEAAVTVPWNAPFRTHNVRFVILNFLDPNQSATALQQMLLSPQQFTPLYVEGRTSIFGWTAPIDPLADPLVPLDKKPVDEFAGLRLDFNRLAFGPNAVPAPRDRPERSPRVRPWWTTFLNPPGSRPPDSDQAYVDWWMFEGQAPLWSLYNRQNWFEFLLSSLSGLSNGPGGPMGGGAVSAMSFYFHPRIGDVVQTNYLSTLDAGPPADLYLAIRAARRGLGIHPDDARTWLILGHSYYLLSHKTKEATRSQPSLREIRQAQAAAALHQALSLGQDLANDNPGLAQLAHETLAQLYRELGFFDLWAKHEKESVRSIKALGRSHREKPESFQARIEAMDKRVKALEDEVNERKNAYQLEAENKPVREKAAIAHTKGLAEEALKILRSADANEIMAVEGPQRAGDVVQRQLTLLFSTGQLEEIRDSLEENLRPLLGRVPGTPMSTYDWFQIKLAVASGDYEQADKLLAQVQQQLAHNPGPYLFLLQMGLMKEVVGEPPNMDVETAVGLLLGHQILQQAPLATGAPWQLPVVMQRDALLFQTVQLARQVIGQEADMAVLRGWLALEAGANADARAHLEHALRRTGWLEDRGWRVPFPGRGLAEIGREWLKP
jgi:hypothetical protein